LKKELSYALQFERMTKQAYLLLLAIGLGSAQAQDIRNNPGSNHGNRFEQLGTILPTPMSIEQRAERPARNTGNSAAITTSCASLMNPTAYCGEKKPSPISIIRRTP
jgi:hypothetical protein